MIFSMTVDFLMGRDPSLTCAISLRAITSTLFGAEYSMTVVRSRSAPMLSRDSKFRALIGFCLVAMKTPGRARAQELCHHEPDSPQIF